jgi:hypothetical protein
MNLSLSHYLVVYQSSAKIQATKCGANQELWLARQTTGHFKLSDPPTLHFASPSTMSVKLDKQIRAATADYKRITPQELKKGNFLEKYLGVSSSL